MYSFELIVAEKPHPSGKYELFDQLYPHPNRWVMVKIGYEEKQLRQVIKQHGGKWTKSKQLWRLPYRTVQELELQDRVVNEELSEKEA